MSDLQTRFIQPGYLGENIVPNSYSLMSSGFATFESQQGDPPEYSSGLGRNSGKSKVAEAHINFDFLGHQPLPIKGQHPSMPKPQLRQQPGFNDMPMWQQQSMFQQLQGLQRQQQLQQLDQQAKQQISVNQLSPINRQTSVDQIPSVVSGMPIHDASSHTWQNELMGSDSKIPSSSQMFMVGNINWSQHSGTPAMHGFPNGLMFSHDQGQALQSMGFVPQHLDQSLYGTPVSSHRGPLNQYSQFLGVSHDCSDMTTKSGANQVGKLSRQSGTINSFQSDQCVYPGQNSLQNGIAAKQSFSGESLFGHIPVQNISSGDVLGNFQKLNPMGRNLQVQESQGGQEQADWPGNSEEKTVPQVGLSQGLIDLDPTEQKLLFSADDEGHCDASFGRSGNINSVGYSQGNFVEGNDYFNGFPSVQSGSWSALMQSAVAEASSSDTGLQDEWSGLSFQKTDPSSGNHPPVFGDSGKQQTMWVDNNLQSAFSLTSKPLFDDADASTNDLSGPMFLQTSVKCAYEQSERVRAEASHEAFRQSSKDASNQLNQNQLQKQFLEDNLQRPMHLEKNCSGVWAGRMYDQPVTAVHSVEVELSSQNMQSICTHQQNMPSYSIGSQIYNKMNGWNVNDSLSPGTGATFKVHDNESAVQHAQMRDSKGTTHIERDQDGNMWKADRNQVSALFPHPPGGFDSVKSGSGKPLVQTENSYTSNFAAVINSNNSKSYQDMNQQVLNRHQGDYGKHVTTDSNGNVDLEKYQRQPNKGSQMWESSINNSDRVLGETYDRKRENSFQKEVSNESYISNHSLSDQHTDSGGGLRENSSLVGNDSHPVVNQKSSGQIGRKHSGSRRFQYHPMGNLGVFVEPTEAPKHTSYTPGRPQMVTCGLQSQELGFIGQSQFASHVVSNNTMDSEKGHLLDSQRNAKGIDVLHSSGTTFGNDTNVSASFDESAGVFTQKKRPCSTSHNMLELFHKVEQSRDSSTVAHFVFSDPNATSENPEAASDRLSTHLQHNQTSALQGFGLRLALPSQQQSFPNQHLSSHDLQTVKDANLRNLDSEVLEKNQTQSKSTVSGRSLPPEHEVSQRENWDKKSSILGQSSKESSCSTNMQLNSSVMVVSGIPYARNQLQQQLQPNNSSASGHVATDQSTNMTFGIQLDLHAHGKNPSCLGWSHESHSEASLTGVVSNQSGQPSMAGVAVRIPTFSLASPSDTHLPVVSQSPLAGSGQFQAMSTSSSHLKNSDQQLPRPESRPVSRPSVTSGMSAILHNVWTNVSTQQHLSGNLPNKVTHNLFQAVIPSSVDLTSRPTLKVDNQGNDKGESALSECGTCSINSQQLIYGEEQAGKDGSLQKMLHERRVDPAPHAVSCPQEQEPTAKHVSDGNSSVTIPSLVCLHQKDLVRSKQVQGSLDQQTNHAFLSNIASSNREISALGHTLKSSDFQHQNYSLLQQMQAVKSVETDPNKGLVKRLKGSDFIAEAQQMFGKGPQNFLYGYNNSVVRVSGDIKLTAAAHHSSFPSDAKMLSFSSEVNEKQNAIRASQSIGRVVPSQDLDSSGLNDPQNHLHSLGIASTSLSVGGNRHAQINPQMAPSWFEQYGTFKNGQILDINNGLAGVQKTAKSAAQHYFFSKSSESMGAHSSQEKGNDVSQLASVWRSTSITTAANEQSPSPLMPSLVIDHNLVTRPKKRKSTTSELLPWHKEITDESRRLQSICMAEMDWAQAANRLIEKVEDESDTNEDGPSMPRARRRIVLTTHLMQLLLPAVPSRLLSADASSEYDSLTYLVAKLALGDACSLISGSGSDVRLPPDSGNTIPEKLRTSESIGEQFFSKVVEDCVGKAKKLEIDLSRLEKRASSLDVRVECQDLERFSIVNRFAKFHGQSHTEGAESSSTPETGPRKIFPQTYVTAHSTDGNLPQGVLCLSL